MQLLKASAIALQYVDLLYPACARIEVAGSIRRNKSEVTDIDIVCIPKLTPETDMFGAPNGGHINHLDHLLMYEYGKGSFTYHLDERSRLCNGPRHKKLMSLEGVKIELWIVLPPAQWGVIMAIRTGPKEHGHWLVTSRQKGGALPSYLRVHEGALHNGSKIVETPEELDFFNALGLPCLPPHERAPRWSQYVQVPDQVGEVE